MERLMLQTFAWEREAGIGTMWNVDCGFIMHKVRGLFCVREGLP
jgi:hypothetical protein